MLRMQLEKMFKLKTIYVTNRETAYTKLHKFTFKIELCELKISSKWISIKQKMIFYNMVSRSIAFPKTPTK